VTLACYSNLLIGLCHKKTLYILGWSVAPYPTDTQPLIKTKMNWPTGLIINALRRKFSHFHFIL